MTVQVEDDLETTGVASTESIVIEEVSLNLDKLIGNLCSKYWINNVSISNVLIEKSNSDKTYQLDLGNLNITNPETSEPRDCAIRGELLSIRIDNLKGLSLVRDQLYIIKVFTEKG